MAHRQIAFLLAGILAVGLAWRTNLKAGSPAQSRIHWQKDIHAAHEVSQKTGKPMLFVFGADWCTYCKKLEQDTLNHPQMAKYVNSSFVPVQLDFDRDKRIAEILNVDKVPCTVVLSPEADLLGKKFGYFTPVPYYDTLKTAHRFQQKIRQASMTTSAPSR